MAEFAKLVVCAVVAVSALGRDRATADDTIPRWDIAEVCAASTLGARCPSVESRNRRAVFNRWTALPVSERAACESAVAASGQKSYRALLACLDDHQLRAIESKPKSSSAPVVPANASGTPG